MEARRIGDSRTLRVDRDSLLEPTVTDSTSRLGHPWVLGAYAVGSTVYAFTNFSLGLSTLTDGGNTLTNRTTANGLGSNVVGGVYFDGTKVYAATSSGVSISL